MNKPWLPVALAARASGLSARHLWRLAAAGKVETRKDGATRLVGMESLAAVASKKGLTCQSKCQSDSWHDSVVESVIAKLRPMVEQAVAEILGRK